MTKECAAGSKAEGSWRVQIALISDMETREFTVCPADFSPASLHCSLFPTDWNGNVPPWDVRSIPSAFSF